MKTTLFSSLSILTLLFFSFLPVGQQNQYQIFQSQSDTAIMKINEQGNVTEYFVIQNLTFTPKEEQIENVIFQRKKNTIQISLKNGKNIELILDTETNTQKSLNSNQYLVGGFSFFQTQKSGGIPYKEAIQFVSNQSPSKARGCMGDCLAGGCGSTSCSRTVWEASCEVSCGKGFTACCGDLISAGCKCKPTPRCCNPSDTAPISD